MALSDEIVSGLNVGVFSVRPVGTLALKAGFNDASELAAAART